MQEVRREKRQNALSEIQRASANLIQTNANTVLLNWMEEKCKKLGVEGRKFKYLFGYENPTLKLDHQDLKGDIEWYKEQLKLKKIIQANQQIIDEINTEEAMEIMQNLSGNVNTLISKFYPGKKEYYNDF